MWYCTIWYIKFWLYCICGVDDVLILLLCYYWYGFISDIAEPEDWKQADDSEKEADIERQTAEKVHGLADVYTKEWWYLFCNFYNRFVILLW